LVYGVACHEFPKRSQGSWTGRCTLGVPSTEEAEAGGSHVKEKPELHGKSFSKKKKKNPWGISAALILNSAAMLKTTALETGSLFLYKKCT
jgi:hypothetical protein